MGLAHFLRVGQNAAGAVGVDEHQLSKIFVRFVLHQRGNFAKLGMTFLHQFLASGNTAMPADNHVPALAVGGFYHDILQDPPRHEDAVGKFVNALHAVNVFGIGNYLFDGERDRLILLLDRFALGGIVHKLHHVETSHCQSLPSLVSESDTPSTIARYSAASFL